MILVVGSTGYLGSAICFKLAAAGRPVTALVRNPNSEKAKALAAAGVALRTGDLKDPASLQRALIDASTVICTASATLSRGEGDSIETVDLHGVQALMTAAEQKGAADFIYVSFDHRGQNYPLALAKQAAEEKLKKSALNWTILQPACFSEIWFSPAVGFDVAGGKVRIYGEGDRPMHYISIGDVTNAVIGAIENPRARRKTYRFGGATAESQLDAVKMFERATGRSIAVERMSLAEIRGARAVTTDPIMASFLGLFEKVTHGFDAEPQWQEDLGVKAQTLESWIAAATAKR